MEMDNRNLTGLAERIRELRRARGLSQEELADQVGVSRQAVSKWEGDQSLPELDKVLALSLLFETSTDYLLKGERPARRNQPDGADSVRHRLVGRADGQRRRRRMDRYGHGLHDFCGGPDAGGGKLLPPGR